MALSTGTILNNRYTIVSVLGQGGMGAVYRADDANLNIPVAVKENLFLSDEYARQFQREAGILASLRHPSLPRVIDYFTIESQGQYLVMDYIDGEDLRQRIERLGSITEREAVLIGISICDALGYLHTRKPPIVHRDIKPGNIKITPEGEIVLVDFGLAKVMQADQATTTGARAMTPGYSPPEQYGTARTDSRTDFYSLGATLYAALSGVIPEDGLSRATGKATLTPLRDLAPRVDRRVANVIEKSMEIEPEDRYQTAEEYQKALIKTGDISPITRGYRVAPPPAEQISVETPQIEDTALDLAGGAIINSPMYAVSRSKKRKKSVQTIISILGGAIVVAVAYFALSGNLGNFSPVAALANNNLFQNAFTPTLLTPQENTPTPGGEETTPPVLTPAATNTSEGVVVVEPTVEPTLESTATPSVTETPAATPLGGGYGELAFVSNRSGSFQVWSSLLEGSRPRQITNLVGGACQPAFSPDGKKLAVISPCAGKDFTYKDSMIYILNSDGSDPQVLPVSSGGDFDPAWSPDNQRLAFTSLRTGTSHIFVYNFSDLTLEELSDTRYADSQPVWSPDGREIAFVRMEIFNHIYIMSDRGQTLYQFSSSGDVHDYWPNWSSDGSFILFGRTKVNPLMPWILRKELQDIGASREDRIPPQGTNMSEIGPIWTPSLSPDNRWIAFEGWPDGKNHDIFIMDFAGNNRQRLTTDPGFDFNPVWIPAARKNSK